MEPDLRQLRYFVVVAEEASFTRAAQRLHLSQPALSAAIRQLERRLGTVLFERTGRQVELTPAGEALLTDARPLLAASQRLVERVTRVASGEEGSVVIASTHSLSAAFVPELMGRLREALPRWRVRHRLGWSLEVTSMVAEGRATVGLVRYAENRDGLCVATLGHEPAVVCVGRGHRLAGRSRVGLQDLAGDRWAVMDREMAPRLVDVFIASCLANGFEPDIAERVSGADFQAMRPAFERIATGELVAQVGASLADPLKALGICCVPLDSSMPAIPIDAVWRDDDPLAHRVIASARLVGQGAWWIAAKKGS